MPRFAANLSLLYAEHAFLDRFAAAAADGFAGVEFLSPYDHAPPDVAVRLCDHGLACVLFNAPPGGVAAEDIAAAWRQPPQRGTACLPGREAEFKAGFEVALLYADALNCPRLHVMAGIPAPNSEPAAVQATYEANLAWAAAQAAPHGVTILIEPINTRDMPGYWLTTQAQAHATVQTVGARNLQVQMDLYHAQITEGDLVTKLRQYLPTGRVGHLQIAGVPDRHEPDVGEVHYPYVFDVIEELGWAGWIGCEYRPRRGASAGGTTAGLDWLRSLQGANAA